MPMADHSLSQCTYLHEADQWYIVKAHQITDIFDGEANECAESQVEVHVNEGTTTTIRHGKTE